MTTVAERRAQDPDSLVFVCDFSPPRGADVRLLERARNEIQLERDQAVAVLRSEFADLTVSAAEKVIGQSLDRQAHQRLIDEVLAESTFREG